MSAILTLHPASANSRAIRRAQLDFPTPPFCEAIAILTGMMTSLCWLVWACWHARRLGGWEAGNTGGENAKVLAAHHAGMREGRCAIHLSGASLTSFRKSNSRS